MEDATVLRAMAANDAYVEALRTIVKSLEQEEARLQGRVHVLTRKRHRTQSTMLADRAGEFKRQVLGCENIAVSARDETSPRAKRARASVDFKRGYFQTPCVTQVGGKLVHDVATPGEHVHARAVRELRAAVLPLRPPPPFPLTWTSNEQSFLATDFTSWPHHHREPTTEEWGALCASAVASVDEKKRRWAQLKYVHHAWSPAEDAQLRELAARRGSLGWHGVALAMSTTTMARFPVECLLRYQRECNPLCVGVAWDFRRWNAATYRTLKRLVDEHGEDWAVISEKTAYRSARELEHKWRQVQATQTSGVDSISCATDRLLVLAAYCYSHRWTNVRWSAALAHVPHPPHGMQQFVQLFLESLSPHGRPRPVEMT